MSTERRSPRTGDHRLYDELAVGWALHVLEPEDEATFARHLPGCERCARTVAETAQVMEELASDLPEDEPSDELRDRIRAAARQTEQTGPAPASVSAAGPDDGPVLPLPRRLPGHQGDGPKRRRWRAALAAAAAVAIVGLGAATGALGVSLQHARTDAARQQQIVQALLSRGAAALAPMTAPDGRQLATVIAADGHVQVVSDGLRVNDQQDSTYVLWGMGHGAPVALGTFDVSNEQPELRPVTPAHAGTGGFSAYGISLEPGRSAPAAPSDVVATGQLPS